MLELGIPRYHHDRYHETTAVWDSDGRQGRGYFGLGTPQAPVKLGSFTVAISKGYLSKPCRGLPERAR